jgi:hypothetical protein
MIGATFSSGEEAEKEGVLSIVHLIQVINVFPSIKVNEGPLSRDSTSLSPPLPLSTRAIVTKPITLRHHTAHPREPQPLRNTRTHKGGVGSHRFFEALIGLSITNIRFKWFNS